MRHAPLHDRLANVAGAVRAQRALRERDAWPRERLEAHQRERLRDLVAFATRRSAFYREHLGGAAPDLPALPTVTKDALMARFDDWVTDPRLRRADAERHLADLRGDELLHGEYRVMATGGSSGTRGVFAYARSEWRELLAHMMWMLTTAGLGPRLPRRRRIASIAAPGPAHMTWRIPASLDVGLQRRLPLAATMPLDELVAALNAFQPEAFNAYPSVAVLLADEQLDGRLRISPSLVSVSSELCTPDMRERIRAAWSTDTHEVYGATDGLWGWSCEHGRLHFAEDMTIVEVVDADGRPVPDGECGHHLLITNLFLRTQPVIRYEITDMVRLHPDPCPCGRPQRAVAAIEGRCDDVLELPAAAGGTVTLHPIHLRSPLAQLETVRRYQVIHRDDGIHVTVVARGDAGAATAEVRAAVQGALRTAGAAALAVHVEAVAALRRDDGPVGKLKLVRSETGGRSAPDSGLGLLAL